MPVDENFWASSSARTPWPCGSPAHDDDGYDANSDVVEFGLADGSEAAASGQRGQLRVVHASPTNTHLHRARLLGPRTVIPETDGGWWYSAWRVRLDGQA